MADNQRDFQSYIYPFALGCLDKEDFIAMVEYIEAGGDFPWQELGELQNLTALLPSFLNIETPDPGVKDRVARTLYKLKAGKAPEQKPVPPKPQQVQKTGIYSEPTHGSISKTVQRSPSPQIPKPQPAVSKESEMSSGARPAENLRPSQSTQVRRRINQTIPDRSQFVEEVRETPAEPAPSESEGLHLNLGGYENEPAPSPDLSFQIPESQPVESVTEPEAETFIINTTEQVVNETVPLTLQDDGSIRTQDSVSSAPIFDAQNSDSAQQEQPIIIQKRGGVSPSIFYIIIILLAAGIGYLYYDFTGKISTLEKNFTSLKESVDQEISTAVSQDRDLVLLLSKKDVMVYSLNGTPQFRESFGRIIYSKSEQRGYMQLGAMPELKANEQKGYQAWIIIGGRSISLNSVPVTDVKRFEFVQISEMPDFSEDPQAQFIVTKEPVTGSKNPGQNVILRGESQSPQR